MSYGVRAEPSSVWRQRPDPTARGRFKVATSDWPQVYGMVIMVMEVRGSLRGANQLERSTKVVLEQQLPPMLG